MTEIHDAPQQTCDRCIARAAHLAVLPAGGELLFCGHHHRIHRERLLASGALVWLLSGNATLRAVDDAA